MHLYKCAEWQNTTTGVWYCNDNQESTKVSNAAFWWVVPRLLEITPAEYVKLLVTEYKCDYIHYNVEYNVLIFSWKSQAQMRKYKNFINKKAREKNFIC